MEDKRASAAGTRPPKAKPNVSHALVVVAHPDDPEFLFGATVAMLARDGALVSYLICSDGSNGSRDTDAPAEEVASTRYAEQREAAALLGADRVFFLGLPDGGLAPTPELRKAIARHIRLLKPDLVITHFPRRVLDIPIEASHPDHVAVGEAALSAVSPDASNARALPELLKEGLAPHRVKEVWVPGYDGANHFVDAAPFVEKKMEAISCHRSQMAESDGGRPPAWVGEWMRWTGSKYGCEYAEDFKRITI